MDNYNNNVLSLSFVQSLTIINNNKTNKFFLRKK